MVLSYFWYALEKNVLPSVFEVISYYFFITTSTAGNSDLKGTYCQIAKEIYTIWEKFEYYGLKPHLLKAHKMDKGIAKIFPVYHF